MFIFGSFLASVLLVAAGILHGTAEAVSLQAFPFEAIPIESFFNSIAASPDGSANFDGKGGSFDSQYLPTGSWVHDGILYQLPPEWGTENDNVIAMNQVIELEKPKSVHELHMLFSGDAGGTNDFAAKGTLNFADNTSLPLEIHARNWWSWPLLNTGAIQTPYNFLNNGTGKNWNYTQIFQWSTAIPSEQVLRGITLPPLSTNRRLHFFALSLSPSTNTSSLENALALRRTRFTNRWETVDGVRAQAVEVTVANLLPTNALSLNTSLNSRHTIEVSGPGIQTLIPGVINRLVPGDQVRVDVLVSGVQDGTNATVEIKDSHGQSLGTSEGWPTSALIEQWSADANMLSKHETPTWWNKAKYGIFIHWGVYSYPAWAPAKSYAEWYNFRMHNPPNASSPTWQHHLDTFGPGVVYDDFIANFTASKFNASEWVDLFDMAGAKYFVFVTKHHDGFALFDTQNTTHRSSVRLGPKRDFVAELLETSAREKPNLRRGTYYSLPEWFNPDYGQYGFHEWSGHLARNAFNDSALEPYTGKLDISDYIEDLQLPHMLTLAEKYGTEIMWCDIGGPNRTLEFAARFYNNAFNNGAQVTMNNRCGAVPDFDTPEYTSFSAIQTRPWESSEGMDPYSYGYNSATNASQYKNGTTIIRTLVDIVSKNGNFLLDIGPTAEGEIIAPMADNLLDAGTWLKHSGDCVYETSFWFQGSQDVNIPSGSNPARFTTTPDTFCIIVFDPPSGGELNINKRLPLLPGDEIELLGPIGNNEKLPWSVDSSGKLTVDVSNSDLDGIQFAWAFRVRYKLQP
ncbi:glycoside hydrolase family 29 protein [Moniliophthora roreri MCA 2997]|uniref:alpha-L-fucosidase n=1 Tax=Moniliophthora roreri (strain MCA 2997) TaxID=1381753 RepID=V2X9X7_MONRO|nr:glycoside hydrolase family 29 protein [Moniliophthora roreri MCA 2997]